MNEARAREILKDAIAEGNRLFSISGLTNGAYLSWHPGDSIIVMDGDFTFEELQAISWWMETHHV